MVRKAPHSEVTQVRYSLPLPAREELLDEGPPGLPPQKMLLHSVVGGRERPDLPGAALAPTTKI